MTDRVIRKTALMFQTNHAHQSFDKVTSDVSLVKVEGDWDTLKNRWLDEPRVVAGYGNVRPNRVADLTGIKPPGSDQ